MRVRGQKDNMMNDVIRGNSFSRVVANEVKKGAYYTDAGMCRRIGKLLRFPEAGEVAVLEPSIGDGSAVRAVLEQDKSDCNKYLFAVELDKKAAEEMRPTLSEESMLLCTDFIRGASITPNVFGYCFSNPPYGTDDFTKRRYEEVFLKLIYTYLKKEGICTYVVPYYLFTKEETFVTALMARFELLAIYRFDDEVYKQFQQVCVVLRRRARMDHSFGKTAYAEFLKDFPAAEELPYLPEEPTEKQKVDVPVAERKNIKVFTTVIFDAEAARRSMGQSPLDSVCGEKLFVPPYKANELPSPPVPTSNGINNMLLVGGAGRGIGGSEETRDSHLYKGNVKTVTDRFIRENEDGKGAVLVEKTRAAVTFTVMEQSGKITRLI